MTRKCSALVDVLYSVVLPEISGVRAIYHQTTTGVVISERYVDGQPLAVATGLLSGCALSLGRRQWERRVVNYSAAALLGVARDAVRRVRERGNSSN